MGAGAAEGAVGRGVGGRGGRVPCEGRRRCVGRGAYLEKISERSHCFGLLEPVEWMMKYGDRCRWSAGRWYDDLIEGE